MAEGSGVEGDGSSRTNRRRSAKTKTGERGWKGGRVGEKKQPHRL